VQCQAHTGSPIFGKVEQYAVEKVDDVQTWDETEAKLTSLSYRPNGAPLHQQSWRLHKHDSLPTPYSGRIYADAVYRSDPVCVRSDSNLSLPILLGLQHQWNWQVEWKWLQGTAPFSLRPWGGGLHP
jgi:hypothetical protein